VSIAVFIDKTTCDHGAPFTGCELDGASFSGSGLKGPAGIAIDGADVWVTSDGLRSLAEVRGRVCRDSLSSYRAVPGEAA
jgi:hypothetical protein